MELYTYYIYEGETTGLKVAFYVPDVSFYPPDQARESLGKIQAQVYLLRFDRYYALTDPMLTTIEPFKDFALALRIINNDLSLEIDGAKLLACKVPDKWPADDSYTGGVPGMTFSDGLQPRHTGYIAFRALDYGDLAGKGYVKALTIKGTPGHVKICTMRERVWETDYKPKYMQQQLEAGSAEIKPVDAKPDSGGKPAPKEPHGPAVPEPVKSPEPVPEPERAPVAK